ncbi:23955_t:CDS:1, partial [Racocetra persica]
AKSSSSTLAEVATTFSSVISTLVNHADTTGGKVDVAVEVANIKITASYTPKT